MSLLTLVYTSTTKVALTLRPQEPAYTAALEPLRDLAKYLTSLTACATLFDAHGATLALEARSATKQIPEAVRSLVRVLLEGEGEDYLVPTGTVHDLIERAKRELPADNRGAVRKKWISDRSMLDDSFAEVTDMIEEGTQDGEEDVDDEGFDDDEWDELGLGSNKNMSAAELDRAKKVQPLLRFSTLLHKRIQLDLLARLPAEPSLASVSALDTLPDCSHELLIAFEEVVASLYAPQDLQNIASAISSLATSIRRLRTVISDGDLLPWRAEPGVDTLTNGMASMSVATEAAGGRGKEKDVRRWLDTCFEQIEKLSRNLTDAFSQESANTT